ncbi:MAG: DUF1553 domain-containing protein, partial [Planctomycetales bacterium]
AILKKLKLDPKLLCGEQRKAFGRLVGEGKTVPFSEITIGSVRTSRGPDAVKSKMTHAKLLGGEAFELKRTDDVRKPLMAWLRDKDNPYFARAFVNRVWESYFHRGIVDPPDDLSKTNAPSNAALLDHLAEGFVESGFDMKWVHREIANSLAYQRSWRPNATNLLDETNFSRAVPRRLPAEVAYDAIRQATASDEEAAKMIEELQGRAIALPGASNRNAARSGPEYALSIFGRSIRESNCDCDRSEEPSLLQTVYLRNDRDMLATIDRSKGSWLRQVADEMGVSYRPSVSASSTPSRRPPANYAKLVEGMQQKIKKLKKAGQDKQANLLKQRLASYLKRYGKPAGAKKPGEQPGADSDDNPMDSEAVVRQAYLRTLSRYPTDNELAASRKYLQESEDAVNGARGLLWALLNTKEFIVNH